MTLLTLVLMLSVAEIARSQESEFTLLEAGVATGILNMQPIEPWPVARQFRSGPVWFYVNIKGTEATLDELTQTGQLKFQYRWFRLVAGGKYRHQDIDVVDVIDASTAQKLAFELKDSGGYYDWRTSNCRFSLPEGDFLVEVVDSHGSRVTCAPGGKCNFVVNVRKTGVAAQDC